MAAPTTYFRQGLEPEGPAADRLETVSVEHSVISVTAPAPLPAKLSLSMRDTTMKNALVLIALTLAIIAGTAAEAVETHQAVLYATTSY